MSGAPLISVSNLEKTYISVGHAVHSSLPVALGYWKDEGLEVSVTSVEGSAAGLQQLGAGNIQIASIGPRRS